MAEEEQLVYFVMYCDQDQSVVLVDESKVMSEPSRVQVGDTVKVDFPGVTELIDCEVKAFSRNYYDMVLFQDKFNRQIKPKRDGSFHEENPRKAKLKCLSLYGSHSQKAAPSKSQVVSEKKDANFTQTDVSKESDFDSQNADTEVEERESSDSDVPPEVLSAIAKLHPKGNLQDIQTIKGAGKSFYIKTPSNAHITRVQSKVSELMKPHETSGGKEQEKRSGRESKDGSVTNVHVKQVYSKVLEPAKPQDSTGEVEHEGEKESDIESKSQDYDLSQVESEESQKNDGSSTSQGNSHVDTNADNEASDSDSSGEIKVSRKKKRSQRVVKQISFVGNQFKITTRPADSTKILEVHPKSVVFISASGLRQAKKAHTPSAMARILVRKVFKKEARAICSTSGKPSFKAGTNVQEVRTALNKKGLEAIIDCVKARAIKMKWSSPTETALKQSIGNRLSDDRLTRLLHEQETDSEVDNDLNGSKDKEHGSSPKEQ